MITVEDLYGALSKFRPIPDAQQKEAIAQGPDAGLFIVAGPGSGKTTCLTLRILKLLLVDQVPPRGILATTFTVKAAQELRSRVLGWGFRIIDELGKSRTLSKDDRQFLADVDINQVWTGTLDSLCEELLRDYRAPGMQPPILADEFVAKTLLLRDGLLDGGRYQSADLEAYLLRIHSESSGRFGFNIATKGNLLQTIWDRRHHDQVNWDKFLRAPPKASQAAKQELDAALTAYAKELDDRGMVDFAMLEHGVLIRLRNGHLKEFTDQLRVVLVDEYQDTNLLQEQLYFELAAACGGALGVVGDDDQSLYRFRGATVDLFSHFAERYKDRFKRKPKTVYLSVNYRSTRNIVSLVNNYATLDAEFQAVRVARKPKISWGPAAGQGQPVLGMFRDSREVLARDLARFIKDVFRGKGYVGSRVDRIVCDPKAGDIGDCALLCSSPQEKSAGNLPRLPLLLRQELAAGTHAIETFNPRGEEFAEIERVAQFGGLLAECIDPGGAVQGQVRGLSNDAIAGLDRWRRVAVDFTSGSYAPKGLLEYAQGWVERDPARRGYEWPRSVPIIELVYGLVHFLPDLHDDPEGQVYLEVFTRQLSACEQVGKFKGRLVADPANAGLSEASVKELIRDFLAPIASGMVAVDEELIEAFPRNRLSILSIHQSKGLEFPITIVDVGSDFRTNAPAQAFKRFPKGGSPSHRLEDELRHHSPLGVPGRSPKDRAFDDLYRQYFVAFSRAQDVLLLVGLTKSLPGGSVQNVATGWSRDGVCHWSGKNQPFVAI